MKKFCQGGGRVTWDGLASISGGSSNTLGVVIGQNSDS